MSDSGPEGLDPSDLAVLSKVARLELAPDRAVIITPALDGALQLFDALDSVDLGETPPANAFDPRWRDLP